jgi:hypothetical protein
MATDVKLDTLNTGAIRVRDRTGHIRFVISINNNVNQHSLSIDVSVYDGDYTGQQDRHKDVAVSFNHAEDREVTA